MDTAEFFSEKGPLASVLKGYAPRSGQIEGALAVEQTFEEGGALILEAGTGVGKSLAALVPAARWAARTGKRVVYVTANIALQEQVVKKDCPLLQSVSPWPFQFELAKGVSNYLCLRRLEKSADDRPLVRPEEVEQMRQIAAWAATTTTGDTSDLPFVPFPPVRSRFTVASEDCVGRLCQKRDVCHMLKARGRLGQAQVIVTNYHMLALDHKLKLIGGPGSGILPEYGAAVLDEAHEMNGIWSEFFGFNLSEFGVKQGSRMLAPDDVERTVLEREAKTFFERLVEFEASDDYDVRIKVQDAVEWKDLEAALHRAITAYEKIDQTVSMTTDVRFELRGCKNRLDTFLQNLTQAMTLQDRKSRVYYVEVSDKGNASLVMKLVEVDRVIAEWTEATGRVVMMSATMAVGRSESKFDFFKKQVGLEEARTLQVESPFDYKHRSMLVVPKGLPEPGEAKFLEKVVPVMVEAIEAAGGRTLILFTSYRALEAAKAELRRELPDYRIMAQGEAPRTALVEEFKRDVSSVLLGTSSFWQGVDVPGEALGCVVIDKLPFEPPDDPIVDLICSQSRSGWSDYCLPKAVIKLKQGVGRLIRTVGDRGVIIVLDRRIVEKTYGVKFVRSLPEGMPVTRSFEDARGLLAP